MLTVKEFIFSLFFSLARVESFFSLSLLGRIGLVIAPLQKVNSSQQIKTTQREFSLTYTFAGLFSWCSCLAPDFINPVA